jgi:alpha-tubulin suppressor-like RCC1 family protein
MGQLGNGSTIDSSSPVIVTGISDAVAVVASFYHSCAVLAGGKVQCWGDNTYGELGNGTSTRSAVTSPVTVVGISNAVAPSAGDYSSCALLKTGELQCWGDNWDGELGNGTTVINSTLPVTVVGVSNAASIAGGSYFSCTRLVAGSLQCWGYNATGELGNGNTSNDPVTTPVSVLGISNSLALDVGGFHSCAVLSDGTVKCWGENYHGQLGDGTNNTSLEPKLVSGITNGIAIAAGYSGTCAILGGGSVVCWGDANQ